MLDDDWFQASLDGDLDRANRIQYRQSLEARQTADTIKVVDDLLPIKRVPAPPCPGFERLDAIMSIPTEEPEPETLATWKPVWSSHWARTMDQLAEELD